MYKIAYIDESDAWINTFYQTFKKDYEVLKIKVDENSSIDGIAKILFENDVDAIVTDYLLEEEGEVSFNGNKIVEYVRRHNPYFPIIMLTAHESQAISHMDDVHIIYGKSILDGESEEELELLKSKIKSNIDNFYQKIISTKVRIEELVKKRNDNELSMPEEEELTKLFVLMDELEPEGKDLPANLIQKESITKLNDFVKEAQNILQELKKLNEKK